MRPLPAFFCLLITLATGCGNDDKIECGAGTTAVNGVCVVDDSGADGEETGGEETGGEETGGEETGGEETGGEETGGSDDGPDELVLPPGLNGNIVDPSVAMVDFSATNMDGSPRSIEDLIDGPTVMWFYPAAATFG